MKGLAFFLAFKIIIMILPSHEVCYLPYKAYNMTIFRPKKSLTLALGGFGCGGRKRGRQGMEEIVTR